MPSHPQNELFDDRPASEWFKLVLISPLLIALAMAMGLAGQGLPNDAPDANAPNPAEQAQAEQAQAEQDRTRQAQANATSGQIDEQGRLVVVIVDSLRPQTLADDSLMPSLYEFSRRDGTIFLPQHTCKANFSLPCIQTMLEGRESPFVAGLHNFTGQAGSEASLPAALARAGYDVALISDHTLDSLYADHAVESIDVQQWKGTHLEHDLKAIEHGQELLAGDKIDVLVLHTIGTDKTAHKDHPGSARYQKHFREVDAALGEFLQTLDLERDSLIIAGDHGHQELGHHTHESVAIFAGADFRSMFDQLGEVDGVAQTDLLYFMSYPLLLPLPTSYEGDIYSSANPTGKFARFLEVQRRHLSAEAGLPADLDAKEAMAKVRQKHQDERFDPALKYAPILLLFFLFVAQALAALGRGPTATDTRVLLALVVASVPVALLTSPDRGLWLALPILLAGAYLAWRRVGLRAHLFLGLVTAAATFTAMNAGDWADFFHTTGGFKPAIVLFYALLFGGGALLATILFDRLPNTLYRLPYGAMAFAFFVLPSGLYYYQAAQNILFGFFVGALPLGIWWLISRRKEGTFLPAEFKPSDWLPTVIVAAGALFLLMQEAGGWNWHLHAVTWMQRLGSVASFVILGLMLTYWIWAAESALKRAAVLLFGVASIFGCTVFGELPVETLAGSLIPAVFLTGYLQLDRRLRADDRLTDGADAHALAVRRGLLVAALTIISLWIATSGFLLQNVDFSFALDWFSEYFALERDVFLFTFLATLVKYGLPPAGVLLALATLARRQDFRPIAIAAFGFLMVEIYVLFVQIFAGSTSGAQKYHELTISALLFVYSLAGVFVASYLVLRAAQALGRRIRGEG